jgi:hypothetical protein
MNQTPFLFIENHGKDLINANYWSSPMAAAGFFFLSINAGCARLLIPDSLKPVLLPVFRTTKHAVMRRTHDEPRMSKICLQILFEDMSDSPYVISMDPQSTDRVPAKSDDKRIFSFAAYVSGTSPVKVFECDLYFGVVKSLPCLAQINPRHYRR